VPKRLPISRKSLRALSLDQLVEVSGYIHQLIQSAKESEKQQTSRRREILEENARDNKTYRLVLIRCGKENCKCAKRSTGHGPYWYAFWSEQGVTKCTYIGKKLLQENKSTARKG
jgi:Family of unknown function (DUF6788)